VGSRRVLGVADDVEALRRGADLVLDDELAASQREVGASRIRRVERPVLIITVVEVLQRVAYDRGAANAVRVGSAEPHRESEAVGSLGLQRRGAGNQSRTGDAGG